MHIHIVKEGDTIYSIAQEYGVNFINIINDNELSDPANLAIGQTIIVLTENLNNVEKLRSVYVNGYAYPYINREILQKTLKYLTYLTIFGYGFTEEGQLVPIDDDEVISIALAGKVAPIMLIAGKKADGTFSSELISELLNNNALQVKLTDEILKNIRAKGYFGLDIDFEYVFPKDREAYVQFIAYVTERLNREGYTVNVDLAPKTSATQVGLLYEAHDYKAIGQVANSVLLMTYEWGYKYGPPMAVAPINKVREVVEFGVTQIDPSIIYLGMPNYGYDWGLPFIKGESSATTINNNRGTNLAKENGVEIKYDITAQSPYYNYIDMGRVEHIVWFENAASTEAKLKLIYEYGLKGPGYWNIMTYFPQNWLVLSYMYDIIKVL